MWKRIRDSGLTLTLLALFAFSLAGQSYFGFKSYNQDREREHLPAFESMSEYARSGHFISSVSENMESEFLQMALFVYLTMCLYQRGSAESKKPEDQMTAEDREKERRDHEYDRRMVEKHPLLWRIYRNSLTLSMSVIFLIFFALHATGSLHHINEERAAQGETALRFAEVFQEPQFWFESFQNWQSEFFSIAIMGVFSIFLRQKDSPQSKKLSDSNWKTGGD